ncbi:MAG: RagB/SusD family nutrient uptake outer membrane protein [Bacteroidetes bacterium]|nr:RagB/SusD family nutrient uptake outer membrane protein [Bacteroidota bacterium]
MKHISLYKRTVKSIAVLAMMAAISCNKKLDALSPHDVNFEDQQFLTAGGFTKATIGNYATISSSAYEGSWFNLSEYRGNNVRFIDVTSTATNVAAQDIDAFNYTNSSSKDFGYSNAFWFASYQELLGVNMVLKHVTATTTDPLILQAKAENLFLRAFVNFNLVRLYGKPYYQSPETSPGIPLVLEPITSTGNPPQRASVKDTYAQIIKDLTDAIPLFSQKKVNSYAGKYAAFALLSRVYLYMSGPFSSPNSSAAKLSQQYADSVISNGGYTLAQGTAYINFYNASNQANAETIWAVNHDAITTGIPKLLMQPAGPYAGSVQYSTGQAKPSPDFLALLTPGDLRSNFYKTDKYPNNATDTLSCFKYMYKYVTIGVYTSYAPMHHLRLAEMYLNRAEARVKQGDNAGALADINVIHTRAGLTAFSGLTGQALFDAILNERRIELAFEGHSSFDYFRNGLPMVRSYSSFNSAPLTVNPTDGKVEMRISDDVLAENPNIKQNPQ